MVFNMSLIVFQIVRVQEVTTVSCLEEAQSIMAKGLKGSASVLSNVRTCQCCATSTATSNAQSSSMLEETGQEADEHDKHEAHEDNTCTSESSPKRKKVSDCIVGPRLILDSQLLSL